MGDPLCHLRGRARDLVYTGVGLSVLGVQRLQVQRRSLEKALGIGLPPTPDDVNRLFGRVTGQR
jgi:hypothetical protein